MNSPAPPPGEVPAGDKLPARSSPPMPILAAHSDLEFLALLRDLLAWSGLKASQCEVRGVLPRSTVYNFVSRKNTALPKYEQQVRVFCRRCGLSPEQVEAVARVWLRLHETDEEILDAEIVNDGTTEEQPLTPPPVSINIGDVQGDISIVINVQAAPAEAPPASPSAPEPPGSPHERPLRIDEGLHQFLAELEAHPQPPAPRWLQFPRWPHTISDRTFERVRVGALLAYTLGTIPVVSQVMRAQTSADLMWVALGVLVPWVALLLIEVVDEIREKIFESVAWMRYPLLCGVCAGVGAGIAICSHLHLRSGIVVAWLVLPIVAQYIWLCLMFDSTVFVREVLSNSVFGAFVISTSALVVTPVLWLVVPRDVSFLGLWLLGVILALGMLGCGKRRLENA